MYSVELIRRGFGTAVFLACGCSYLSITTLCKLSFLFFHWMMNPFAIIILFVSGTIMYTYLPILGEISILTFKIVLVPAKFVFSKPLRDRFIRFLCSPLDMQISEEYGRSPRQLFVARQSTNPKSVNLPEYFPAPWVWSSVQAELQDNMQQSNNPRPFLRRHHTAKSTGKIIPNKLQIINNYWMRFLWYPE